LATTTSNPHPSLIANG
jgi:hypothetical protein